MIKFHVAIYNIQYILIQVVLIPLNPCSLKQSSVRSHSDRCGSLVSPDDFEVLGHQKHDVDLRILESLYILKTKPNLNEMNFVFPLKLVN